MPVACDPLVPSASMKVKHHQPITSHTDRQKQTSQLLGNDSENNYWLQPFLINDWPTILNNNSFKLMVKRWLNNHKNHFESNQSSQL